MTARGAPYTTAIPTGVPPCGHTAHPGFPQAELVKHTGFSKKALLFTGIPGSRPLVGMLYVCGVDDTPQLRSHGIVRREVNVRILANAAVRMASRLVAIEKDARIIWHKSRFSSEALRRACDQTTRTHTLTELVHWLTLLPGI